MNSETALLEIHEQAGATMGTRFGTQLPSGYGDFDAEYRFARDAVALIDTNFQMVADLTGPDRVRYLNAVTSANIQGLASGDSAIGVLLNAQGHILAELRALALPDRLTILSHAMAAERTLATLDKFIIMDDATLTDRSTEFGTMALVGPGAVEIAAEITSVNPDKFPNNAHVEADVEGTRCRVLHACFLGVPGIEWLAERAHLATLWKVLAESAKSRGGGIAGYRAINALRLEAGSPWFGADFDDRVIPHEAGIEQSHISYTKGCYTGQEIVERVRSRGRVNRRLTGLAFGGNGIPEPGARLLAGQDEVGRVTSAAYSPRAQRTIGLGYLRHEFREPGGHVIWEGGEVEAIELPIGDATGR